MAEKSSVNSQPETSSHATDPCDSVVRSHDEAIKQ